MLKDKKNAEAWATRFSELMYPSVPPIERALREP